MTSKKVLIIDDDNRNIFALRAVLKAKGYECLAALSAETGIEMMKEDGHVAIVLMDMMMPDMDGYQAMAKMREDEELKDIPVIAVTAQAMMGDRERCLEAGALDYVSKPINVDLLTKMLTKYIG